MKRVLLASVVLFLFSSGHGWAQSARDPIPLDTIAKPRAGGAAPALRRNTPAAAGAAPKLVVILVADQFRADYLRRFGADFGRGGFARLLREGAVFQGHYGQQNTYTGPGHALIASGSYAYVNGIMQNKWWNNRAHRSEAMLHDPEAKLLHGETTAEDETSPRNFWGSTIGDELRLASPESRVVAVALKDRGAIMLGGRTGKAYFQSETTGDMTSSTYYGTALPAWATAWNDRRPADAFFGKTWDRLLPPARYPETDDVATEAGGKGLGRTFPHKVTGKLAKPGPDYFTDLQHTPFGLDLTFDFVRAALDGEKLGKRGVTDLLGISITPTDIAGHAFGAYSQEVHDLVVRLDRAIEAFLADLDHRFAAGEVVLVFTADHGAVPIPEQSAAKGLTAARLKKAAIKDAVDKALQARFGAGAWVLALEDPSLYLDRALIAAKKLDPAEVERVAGEAVLGLPGVLGYHTRTQLQNGWLPPTELARAVARSYVPTRSGDVVIVQAPFSFWGKYAEKDAGATHGSFFRYDTDVPLVFVGKPFRPGNYGDAEMVDLAPTLTELLGVARPAACEGRPLFESLR
jgi:predicted AlkP superfamily pyrophosphatase or phosphodiesterase